MHRILCVALLAACTSDGGGDDAPPVDGAPPAADSGEAPDAADPGADMTAGMAPDAGSLIAMGFAVGQRAPDFALLDHTGARVALSDLRGRPVLVAGASAW